MSYTVALVAVENTAYSFDMLYSYLVPSELENEAMAGCRVLIPFGNSRKKRQGIIFSVVQQEDKTKLKRITAVLDKAPLLNFEALSLASWLKERTFCTYYDAAKIQLPTGINLKIRTMYVYVGEDDDDFSGLEEDEKKICEYVRKCGEYVERNKILDVFSLDENTKILDKLVDKELLYRNYDSVRKVGDATCKMVKIDFEGLEKNAHEFSNKQKRIIELLSEIVSASVKEVCYFTGATPAIVRALAAKKAVEIYDIEVYRKPKLNFELRNAEQNIMLSEEQQTAYENMLKKYNNGGGCSLLFGVTGSGKTSVYMKLIDRVLDDGKGIIVMVPEISLTPQLLAIFKKRYGDKIAVFHSGLSVGERYDEWKRVKNGDASIAIGTRSAVFAPFENIGLIIMDEEQEHTYKSEQSPKFHTRDVAKWRASYNKALLVLASATPSFESYTLAKMGRYSLEKLSKRYGNANLPSVITVDMRRERKNGNKYSISSLLLQELEENLKDGEQSILLINRRGYNTFAACDECGHVRVCPSCNVSLSYHADNRRLMCHYCGYSVVMDKKCPECGKPAVRFSGSGTQKIEDELKELLPEARVIRMDTDSTLSRYAHEDKLSAFASGEYDILLGTQMVAKGLDFDKVTLVGVLSADQEMNGNDYMSSERAFDLLTQVVGRAGRGDKKGRAVIQTINPDSSIIRMAQRQNYEAFYNNEIYIRKFMAYPPYSDICAIDFCGEDEFRTLASSRCFLHGIREYSANKYTDLKLIVLGPMTPRVSKVNGKYRFRIIIKCRNTRDFRSMIKELVVVFQKVSDFKDISVSIDINPDNLA